MPEDAESSDVIRDGDVLVHGFSVDSRGKLPDAVHRVITSHPTIPSI